MTISRRDFLAASALTSSVSLPAFFRRVAQAAPKADQSGARETVLVVIQLTGGNDGLNTVVPHRDPDYRRLRPTLGLKREDLHAINEDLALHPSLRGFSDLLEDNRLAIIQGVGYPNPNRSHFLSMDIWHKATPAEREAYGWIGRMTPLLPEGSGALHIGPGDGPLALFGATGHAPSLESLAEYKLRVAEHGDDPARRKTIQSFAAAEGEGNPLLSLVRSSALETYRSAEQIQQAAAEYDTPITYPDNPLARQLKLIAQLIDAGLPERVYYTSLEGFDTHARQAFQHNHLLEVLGDSLLAFLKDITHHGQQKRVLVMTFSEFGRRVKENGSLGTDHGAASQIFLAGDMVQPGVLGAHPSLSDLDDGDLKFHTDFRSVYATILDQWLGVSPAAVLDAEFPQLALFA